jgi:hypothetical protein
VKDEKAEDVTDDNAQKRQDLSKRTRQYAIRIIRLRHKKFFLITGKHIRNKIIPIGIM